MRFHIYFTYWVQSGKSNLRKINNPRKALCAVLSTFSPATRISTWDEGSLPKERDLDQDISSSWAGNLIPYLWRVMDRDSILSSILFFHFIRNIQPHFPVSTTLEGRTNSVLLGHAIYKYFLQQL